MSQKVDKLNDAMKVAGFEMEDRFMENRSINMFLRYQHANLVLGSIVAAKKAFNGDLNLMSVFFAISQGSLSHIKFDDVINLNDDEFIVPDSMRRPVSILGVSEYLDMPYETTRRHVMNLVESGFCKRFGRKEFVVDTEALLKPELLVVAKETALVRKKFLRSIFKYIKDHMS